MDAIEMIKERRSVRNYKNEPVSRETIKEIVELCRWAPSWANFQVARYTIVDDPKIIKRLYEEGVKGFVYNMNTLKNAKGVMILSYVKGKSGSLGDKADDNAKTVSWEMFDAGIACQTFCLAAHAKGVGTCVFGVIDNDAIHSIVSLDKGESVASIITYGYEEGDHATAPQRKKLDEILRICETV